MSQALLPNELPAPSIEHHESLMRLATWIAACQKSGTRAKLVFVCTHNSRRSQFAQVWAWQAALSAGLDVLAYSAGTEATAVAEPVLNAFRRSGLDVHQEHESKPPVWRVLNGKSTLDIWSKTLDDASLPSKDFAAIMVCSDADEHCPHVPGAAIRIALPYTDPKSKDGTPEEAAAYQATSRQIAADLLMAFQTSKRIWQGT